MNKKYIVITVLLIATAVMAFWFLNKSKSTDITSNNGTELPKIEIKRGFNSCEICGYLAKLPNDSCQQCMRFSSDSAIKEFGYSRNEFITLEQLDYFASDTAKFPNLFKPEISLLGYPKDPKWRPIVSADDVYNFKLIIQKNKEVEDSLAMYKQDSLAN